MSTATNTIEKSQEQFNAEVAEFFGEWNALSFEERDAPISIGATSLQERAVSLMAESTARTCPEWCDKTEHRGNVGAYWGNCIEDGLNTHSGHFGDSVAMGNEDGSSGVTLLVYINAAGAIIEGSQVHVEEHDQPTVAQAVALADAIREAANFLEELQKRESV
jgi:hypothetical protein